MVGRQVNVPVQVQAVALPTLSVSTTRTGFEPPLPAYDTDVPLAVVPSGKVQRAEATRDHTS